MWKDLRFPYIYNCSLLSKILVHPGHQTVCQRGQRGRRMVGRLISQLYIHGRNRGKGSLGQIHGHGAAGKYLDSCSLKAGHQAFTKALCCCQWDFTGSMLRYDSTLGTLM